MARTQLNIYEAKRNTSTISAATMVFDNANGMYLPMNDGEYVIDVTATAGQTMTVRSNRLDGNGQSLSDAVYTFGTGAYIVGPFEPGLFNQADGSVYVDASAALSVVRAIHFQGINTI